jgi:hypothetical protein
MLIKVNTNSSDTELQVLKELAWGGTGLDGIN